MAIKNKSETIQPFILAVGENVLNITEIFLYFDGVKYPFKNFLRAIDICFKTFYVFNLEYPPASFMFWSFFQHFFFKIEKGKKNLTCSKVHVLAEYLNV